MRRSSGRRRQSCEGLKVERSRSSVDLNALAASAQAEAPTTRQPGTRLRPHGQLLPGPPLRRAHPRAQPRLRCSGGAHARAWRRRERRDLQRRERGAAAAAAVGRARPRGDDLEPLAVVRQDVGGRRRGERLPARAQTLAEVAAWERRSGEPDRGRRARAHRRRDRDREPVLHAGRRRRFADACSRRRKMSRTVRRSS